MIGLLHLYRARMGTHENWVPAARKDLAKVEEFAGLFPYTRDWYRQIDAATRAGLRMS